MIGSKMPLLLVAFLLFAGLGFAQYGGRGRGDLRRKMKIQALQKKLRTLEARLRNIEKHVAVRGSTLELKATSIRIEARANLRLQSNLSMDVEARGALQVNAYRRLKITARQRTSLRSLEPMTLDVPTLVVNGGKRFVCASKTDPKEQAQATKEMPTEDIRPTGAIMVP